MTNKEKQYRMEVCPWREHATEYTYVCTRYGGEGTTVLCDGACSWVY